MRIRTKLAAVAAAGALGSLAVTAPAFAAGGPTGGDQTGCTSSCASNVSGTITVSQTLTLSLDFNAFALTPGGTDGIGSETSDGWTQAPGGANLQAYITVGSNDGLGYFVTESSTPFGSLAADTVDSDSWASDSQTANSAATGPSGTWMDLSSSPQDVVSSTGVSDNLNNTTNNGDDNWAFFGYRTDPNHPIPANTAAGSFIGTVTFALWGN